LKLREAWKATLAQLIAGGKVSDEFLESINRLLAENNFHEALGREEVICREVTEGTEGSEGWNDK
jgi:hypothetical protein